MTFASPVKFLEEAETSLIFERVKRDIFFSLIASPKELTENKREVPKSIEANFFINYLPPIFLL
ncbi:hypothetical protein [Fusobacterium necrogenes]|uniref:hypothetical protein n=1 Tax=Fusobacterium necrogenes TaxID=858 RepID=UPI00255C372B|nr:hypothetical protein [Fusobacterium necrogenes]